MALTEDQLAEIRRWSDGHPYIAPLLAEVDRLEASLRSWKDTANYWAEACVTAEYDRKRLRLAWESARRGRRSARLLNRELVARMQLDQESQRKLAEAISQAGRMLGGDPDAS